MAYIYKITNDINQKIYIGKTEFSIEKRFKEHCSDAFKDRNEKRSLYAAMRKYGIENFHIELVEETDNPEERETYWIEYYGSFKNGYNLTLGGDGKKYIDYDLVVKTYQEIQNIRETARILKIDEGHASKILKIKNISTKTSQEILKEQTQKPVGMIDLNNNNLLNSFSSLADAAKYLIENNKTTSTNFKGIASHIGKVCNGKRGTAYGYKWKFL